MRVVIQRVKEASVLINGKEKREISRGLVVLAGFESSDNKEDIDWLARKIINLRIFDNAEGVMNLSLEETGGQLLVISQFTLHAKTKKGNRPSYIHAAKPDIAIPLYNEFVKRLDELASGKVITGEFGAHMDVALVNDGPVTIVIDTKNKE